MRSLIYFFIYATLFLSNGVDVVSAGNIWIQTYQNSSKLEVDIWTRGRFGFTIVEIAKSENVTVFFMSGNSYGHWLKQLGTNFTTSLVNMTVLTESFIPDSQVVGNVANEVQLRLSFPFDFLQNSTTIRVGYGLEVRPFPLVLDEDFTYIVQNDTPIVSFFQPNCYRYEHIHISLMFIHPTIIIVLIILVVCLFRFQPLRSRGLAPLIACILGLLHHTKLYFILAPLTEIINRQNCVWDGMLIQASTISLLLLLSFVYTRYVTLTSLNQRKEAMIEKKIKYNLLFLKFIGSWWMNLIVIVIGWMFWYFIVLLLQIGFLFKCSDLYLQIQIYLYLVVVLIELASLFIILFIDIYLNWAMFKKCDVGYFWKQDLHWIRFELYVLGCLFGFPMLIANTLAILVFQDQLVRTIMISIMYHWVIAFLVIFPLSLTILNLIIRCFHKRPEMGGLRKVLFHPKGFQLMYDQCKLEYSLENISCWKDLNEFKFTPTKENAERIVTLYFQAARSDLEVNISSSCMVTLQSRMRNNDIDAMLFDNCSEEVLSNLADTYSRLKTTSQWKLFAEIEAATMEQL